MPINVYASELARFLGVDLIGDDILINRLASFDNPGTGTLSFLNRSVSAEQLAMSPGSVVITLEENADVLVSRGFTVIPSVYPKYDAARIANSYLPPPPAPGIHPSAVIGPNVEIGNDVAIGPGCVLDGNIRLGDACILGANISLLHDVTIGSGTTIRNGTVIGENAFSFGFGPDGTTELFPSSGGVRIGKRVLIGNNAVISRGVFDHTVIEDDVRINELVWVGNMVIVRRKALIMAHTAIAARAVVGERSWIGLGAKIRQNITIGNDVMIGMGAVVTRDVANGKTAFGVPARVRDIGE